MTIDEMQKTAAATLESIQSLERIAMTHVAASLEDVEKTLAMLEQRRPQ